MNIIQCAYCGEEILDIEAVKDGEKYFHDGETSGKDCYEKWYEEMFGL